MNNFRSIKNATRFDEILPPKADPKRVGLISAGNSNVLREAAGLEDYSRKRKRGGRVKLGAMSGVRPKHRLDRPSRRKFDSGGSADADQSAASSGDTPRVGSDALRAIPKIRALGDALMGFQKAGQVLNRWGAELGGSKPAYRAGGRADAPRIGSDVLRANSKVRAVGAAARQGARR
jgi:hypothetical protein